MWKLIRVYLALCLPCIIGVAGALALGKHGGETAPFAQWFTNPDGSPCQYCLFGLQPGITTLAEARHILSQHPLTRDIPETTNASANALIYSGPRLYVFVRFDSTDNRVFLITGTYVPAFSVAAIKLPFSDVIAVLGHPSGIVMRHQIIADELINVQYQSAHLEMTCLRGPLRLTISDLCNAISIHRDTQLNDPPEFVVPWRGFTSPLNYASPTDEIFK